MKIRCISDLHLDVNSHYNFTIPQKNQDVFTVIAGDTSGDPRQTIKWIKKNIRSGLLISGNHLVYNDRHLGIQDLRDELHKAFPADSDITYLDAECGVVSKVVDNVLFVGTCLYTDMMFNNCDNDSENIFETNCYRTERGMNDFRWGAKSWKKIDYLGGKYDVADERMTAKDYANWFKHAMSEIDKIISENECSENPLPVIVISHHGLSDKCVSSKYVDSDINCAYVSDCEDWIKSHLSIKACIYGHIHEHDAKDRVQEIVRDDGTKVLLINNARGYCSRCEDFDFNPNFFIDTDTWNVEITPLSKSQLAKKNKLLKQYHDRMNSYLKYAWF